jgi:aspartyl-tRNA(Asn)/glutamyl-tRNA(Gln) amidotransferase subunit B
MDTETFETVIGLECHVELSTVTKMFCGCANAFGSEPNTNVCPVCLGHPGSLPVPNEKAIEYTIRIGLALGCRIAPRSLFHRKNYFYPDMPKNFQISQYDLPLCVDGHLDVEVDGQTKRVGITRVHLEEDTGKTSHAGHTGRIAEADYALEDYNRAGVPLVEVVSEPDMRSPEEARAYVTELRATLKDLGVSDVRMEEGSLRCDANVSLRAPGSEALGTKIEIKNLNSIRSVYRALRFEVERQSDALLGGHALAQETRHWDEHRGLTTPGRSKEYASDYRYFPEPDLTPLEPDPAWVEEIGAGLPEAPAARRARLEDRYRLRPDIARLVGATSAGSRYFEAAVAAGGSPAGTATWMTQDLAAHVNRLGLDGYEELKVGPDAFGTFVHEVESGTLSSAGGKAALERMVETGQDVGAVVEEMGLRQVSDAGELGAVIDRVIADNPGPVEQFRGGKEGVLGFLVGQVMKQTGGSADPKMAGDLLRSHLER